MIFKKRRKGGSNFW